MVNISSLGDLACLDIFSFSTGHFICTHLSYKTAALCAGNRAALCTRNGRGKGMKMFPSCCCNQRSGCCGKGWLVSSCLDSFHCFIKGIFSWGKDRTEQKKKGEEKNEGFYCTSLFIVLLLGLNLIGCPRNTCLDCGRNCLWFYFFLWSLTSI